MSSTSPKPILAVLGKEIQLEFQNIGALLASSFFGLVSVLAISFTTSSETPSPTTNAGIFCVVLLFSSVLNISRTFIHEDEQSTFDLMRMHVQPSQMYLGKAACHALINLVLAVLLIVLFVLFAGFNVLHWDWLLLGVALESLTLTATICMTSMLVVGASHRWILVALISMVMLLPQTAMAISVLRFGLGTGFIEGAAKGAIGLAGMLLMFGAGVPALADAVWKRGGNEID